MSVAEAVLSGDSEQIVEIIKGNTGVGIVYSIIEDPKVLLRIGAELSPVIYTANALNNMRQADKSGKAEILGDMAGYYTNLIAAVAGAVAEGNMGSKGTGSPKEVSVSSEGVAEATRNPIFADNNLLVAAAEKGHAGALTEIRAGKTYITPNQYNEFLNVSSSAQRNARIAFLKNEGIKVFSGEQAGNIAATKGFQQIFQKVVPIQGRGDAALSAFAEATGYEAVTMEKRLFNLFDKTWPQLGVPIRRVQ
jgi:hypothetical protein